MCNQDEVEDEIHVLFYCSRYENLRNEFCTFLKEIPKNTYGLVMLLKTQSSNVQLNVAKYLLQVNKLRETPT